MERHDGSRDRHERSLERHPARVRRLHALVYVVVLPVLFTGWWLYTGHEGNPSPLARSLGVADIRVHVWLGRAMAVLWVVVLVVGRRGVVTFVRETFRSDRGDRRWWTGWPIGALTGRFRRHEGLFDPGQRVANVVMILGLAVLTLTGLGLTIIHGGPTFALLAKVHLWTTFVVTAVVAGHILIAVGILPGYRGVWRSIHVRGRVRHQTAHRVWPAWTERALAARPPRNPPTGGPRRGRPKAMERR